MGLQRKSITIASQSQCFCTKHRCQKGLKSSQCLAIYWRTIHYKTASYFPYLQRAGMLLANTPKVKRCLSRKRTIEIPPWAWAFCAAFTLQSFDFSVVSHGLIQTHSASATYRFRLELCQGQEIVHNLFYWKTAREWHGLKAQKLIAQGSALGNRVIKCTPCKGKSKHNTSMFKRFCPCRAHIPQRNPFPGHCPGL